MTSEEELGTVSISWQKPLLTGKVCFLSISMASKLMLSDLMKLSVYILKALCCFLQWGLLVQVSYHFTEGLSRAQPQ